MAKPNSGDSAVLSLFFCFLSRFFSRYRIFHRFLRRQGQIFLLVSCFTGIRLAALDFVGILRRRFGLLGRLQPRLFLRLCLFTLGFFGLNPLLFFLPARLRQPLFVFGFLAAAFLIFCLRLGTIFAGL